MAWAGLEWAVLAVFAMANAETRCFAAFLALPLRKPCVLRHLAKVKKQLFKTQGFSHSGADQLAESHGL